MPFEILDQEKSFLHRSAFSFQSRVSKALLGVACKERTPVVSRYHCQLLNQIVCELPPEHPLSSVGPLRDSLGRTPLQSSIRALDSLKLLTLLEGSSADMEEPQPQSHPLPHGTDCRDARIMAKLRDSLLSQAPATFNPAIIERRIRELFCSFNTPAHPPYSLMIQRAIKELNEGNGSTEEAISEFIKKEFKDLPWAHTRILGLHLEKLCQAKELWCTESGRYMLMEMVDCGNFVAREETEWRGSKRRKRNKRGRNNRGGERNKTIKKNEGTDRDNGLQKQENEEQNQLGTATNEPSRIIEREDEGIEEQGEAHQQAIEMIEEKGKSEKGLLGMIEECHGWGTQAQGEAEKQQNGSVDKRIEEASLELNDKIKVTTEISDEKSGDENLCASHGGPTIVVIPEENLQILEQEEQQQNKSHSVQQKFSDASKLLVDQEDTMFHLETICSSQTTAPDPPGDLTYNFQKHLMVPVSEETPGIELTPTKLQLQMPRCGHSETDLCAASKMSASLSSMNVHEHKQPQDWTEGSPKGRPDENTTLGDPEQNPPKPQHTARQPNPKHVADYPVESLLPSDDGILNEQEPKSYKFEEQQLSQPCGSGRGRGRPRKLDKNPQQSKELLLQDQAHDLVSSLNSEPKETIHSSQPVLNHPVTITPNHQQQLKDLISEETSRCIPSRGLELSPIEMQLRQSWDRLMDSDLGTTSKLEASLSSVNVHEHKQLQHWIQGSPNWKLDENPTLGNPEQHSPKPQRRGRPANRKPGTDYPVDPFFTSDGIIFNEQTENNYQVEKQLHMQRQGRGRGSGRSSKLDRNAYKCKEQLQVQDQGLGLVSSPNLEPKKAVDSPQPMPPDLPVNLTLNSAQQLMVPILEESPECILSTGIQEPPTQLQLQLLCNRFPDTDLGATSKMAASLSSVNVYEDQPEQHGNEVCPKRKLDEKTDFRDIEQQPPKCQRRGRPSKLNSNEPNIKQQQLQPRGRGRGGGRPSKLNKNEPHSEELRPQDQAQGQLHSPNMPDDNQSCEPMQLQQEAHTWSEGRCPELESGVNGSCQKQQLLSQGSSGVWGRPQWQQMEVVLGLPSSPKQKYRQLKLQTCPGTVLRLRKAPSKSNPDAS